MDERDLRRALAADPDAAFEALLRCHIDRVYTIALRLLGNAADAEEVAQDTFVRAYRAIGRYDAERIRTLDFRAWLARIAVNAARSRRRRLGDRQPTVPLGSTPERPTIDGLPEREVIRRAETERLGRLVADLPERYRVPIVLRFVDDLSFPQMAEVLGRPEGTLRAQVHRGLALLRAAHDAGEREEMTA